MKTEDAPGLEVFAWTEAGYAPLVFSHDWQVALLNWEPLFDLPAAGEIERHNRSDEVFVLVKGQAVLFTITAGGAMTVTEMQPGVVCNVRQGCWHNLIASREASWVIVENRDTHLHDCEFRQLTAGELGQLKARLPAWACGSR